MSDKPKNPNAFPLDGVLVDKCGDLSSLDPTGMTLRDYFAAKAMQADLSSHDPSGHQSDVAKRAYQVADWMLVERSKEEDKIPMDDISRRLISGKLTISAARAELGLDPL